jgi:starch-binding outer membrane protein, SusD/RagB family
MKRYISILFLAVLLITIQSCESYLEEHPKGFASSENVLNSETGITQTLYGVYSQGTQIFWRERYPTVFALPGDDVFPGTDNNTGRIEMDNFTFTSESGDISRVWAGASIGISRANLLIEGIQNYEDGPFKERILAEAKFLRAMFYFYQVRTFGEVPLLTEYESAELYPSKATIPEIYDQIVADFKDAEQTLPGWQEITGEKGRATRGAAKAFLGKVYLTMATTPETADVNYFSLAASKLKEVIDEGYGLIDNYVEAFQPQNEGGKEDVWSWQFLQYAPSGNQGYINSQFQPNPTIYNKRGFGRFAIMPYLYDMFEPEDERVLAMIKGTYTISIYSDGTLVRTKEGETPNGYPYTTKFTDPVQGKITHNQDDTNWPIIRFADILLMYSEAVNESAGSTDEAYYGIDLVRARSNASALPRGLSQEELRQKIREERLLELHGEGHSWFDLVRWGNLAERIKEVNPDASVQWPRHRFFPIPQTEVDANPNLDQNELY